MLKPLAIAVLTLGCSAAFAAGEIYRWKDASGTYHYSDQPRAGAEVIRASSSGSTIAGTTAAAAAPAPVQATANESLPVSKEIAQQVRQEAGTAKAKACEDAKKDYDEKIRAQRIHRTDDKGNRTYLNNEEIDVARLEARARRDLACGS
jgi:hypothetical protein